MNIQGNILVKGVDEPHVVIPEGVEIIGERAFAECTNITSVVFPSTLTGIGNYAFSKCSRLTGVVFPSTLTSIRVGAFLMCSGLTSVTFPEGLTSIGVSAFTGCSGLTSVDLSQTSLTTIGRNAFLMCSGLTSVDLSQTSLTSIGEHAFYQCYDLTSVVFPSTLNSIGSNAFYQCYDLTSIIFPSTLNSIGSFAFGRCTSLKVLVPPCQVHPTAFRNCLLVLNASGRNIPGSVVLDPRIISLRQRLLALWSQNVRRQGRMRQSGKNYKILLSVGMMDYEQKQSKRERPEVLQIWREIKQILARVTRRDEVVEFLFRKIIAGGKKLVTMKTYLNQPEETKVFKKVLKDLGIEEPRRFRNWGGRLESRLRF